MSAQLLAPYNDPELSRWLLWASERGDTPAFVRTVAEAALTACSPDCELLRPVLIALKRQYPDGGPCQIRDRA